MILGHSFTSCAFFLHLRIFPSYHNSNPRHCQSQLRSLSIQPCEKPRRPWRTSVWVWRSSRKEQGNSTSTWAWFGPVSTAPSTTRAVTTRSQTPPLHSCAETSASLCLSCRSAPTSHGYKTTHSHVQNSCMDTNVHIFLSPWQSENGSFSLLGNNNKFEQMKHGLCQG